MIHDSVSFSDSRGGQAIDGVSHSLNLACGCTVYVSCHPIIKVAYTRIIERRGPQCTDRRHGVGVRLWLWDLLPERQARRSPIPEPLAGSTMIDA
jgi:hypothetical protein